jgi:hypothetical protein
VSRATFSADGRLVITVCKDGSVRVWDSETGEPLTPALKHPNVQQARFLPQGHQFLTLDARSAWHWDLAVDPLLQSRPASDLNLIAHLLSGHQSVQAGAAILEDPQTMQANWGRLRERFAELFITTADEINCWRQETSTKAVQWHVQEANKCEAARQWFAARFHLERLSRLQPARPDHYWRQAYAAAEWSQTTRQALLPSSPGPSP